MSLRPLFLGLVIGFTLLLVASPQGAFASHHIFTVENPEPDYNPNGGVNGRLFGMNVEWEVNGRSNLVCSDYGPNYTNLPVEIRDSIAGWESVLPGTQFFQGCPGGRSATWFLRRTVSAGYPCEDHPPPPGAVVLGCTRHFFAWDSSRKAYYPGSTNIWINDLGITYNYSGLRGLASHELGHCRCVQHNLLHKGRAASGVLHALWLYVQRSLRSTPVGVLALRVYLLTRPPSKR
jgi:hypothetical protein